MCRERRRIEEKASYRRKSYQRQKAETAVIETDDGPLGLFVVPEAQAWPQEESAKIGLAVWIGLAIVTLSLGVARGLGSARLGGDGPNLDPHRRGACPRVQGVCEPVGIASLVATYLFLQVVMTAGAVALHVNRWRFITGFTLVFAGSYASWIIGSWAYIAATTDRRQALGVGWSMNLTSEAGFLVALVAGRLVGNLAPSLVSAFKDAVRPEWYIKTAIVILGGCLGITAAERLGLATTIMVRSLCAIIEAYLLWRSFPSSRDATSNSPGNGQRRSRPGSRSAASRRPSPPRARSGRVPWCPW